MTKTKPAKQRERAVVCLSGGMDSCVTAALAARDYETYGIHFSYGQLTETREFNSARDVAQALGIREVMHLRIDIFRRIGGSALTDSHIAVPHAAAGAALDGDPAAGDPRHLRSLPQRALSLCRRKLGGGAGRQRRSLSARSSRTAPAIPTAGPPTTRPSISCCRRAQKRATSASSRR